MIKFPKLENYSNRKLPNLKNAELENSRIFIILHSEIENTYNDRKFLK